MNGHPHDILVEDGTIAAIAGSGDPPDVRTPSSGSVRELDAAGLHAFPSFRNGHTHVAMVLFRGYGDDMPLMEWLQTRIWPAEGRLTPQDVYHGARLGILEMIQGGTTFFNEMYWHRSALREAAEEMGVRALIGSALIDLGDPGLLESQKAETLELAEARSRGSNGAGNAAHQRISMSLAPHSIYTLRPRELEWVAAVSDEYDLPVHIHLSETAGEVTECLETHGCRPAELLERTGLMNGRLIAVHGQFLSDGELELLSGAGAALVTNPTANLKLATGGIFPYVRAREAGVRICLGTDGAASNNNLDMLEEMKFAALLQKHREEDATALPAAEALAMCTEVPAQIFGQGSGRVAVGEPADLVLMDLSGPSTQPLHDPVSALVYAANASHVQTTICAGKVLMHRRVMEGCDPEEIMARANEVVRLRM